MRTRPEVQRARARRRRDEGVVRAHESGRRQWTAPVDDKRRKKIAEAVKDYYEFSAPSRLGDRTRRWRF